VLTYAYWRSHFEGDRSVVGRTVQLNKSPFTIVGVAPPEFRGTLLFFSPDFFVPIVEQEQVDGWSVLNARGNRCVTPLGHVKAGITPAQAIADLNSIGSDLEKNYPKDDGQMSFLLARPSLYGDSFSGPVQAFLTGLMLLAGLILLAVCANLGNLVAARAADRSREVALRLAMGAGRTRILRQLFTEAVLVSLMGGAVGLWCSLILLRGLSTWQPIPQYPINIPVSPDANVYGVALLLAVAGGFLFGAVPVRQVLHTDPYQIVKSGSIVRVGRRLAVRDLLLGVQIAICAVLVTSSFVAVRGLLRSLHSNFGFEPRNTMLVNTDLNMAGYRGDRVRVMQKRMIDAMETIPGVTSVGLVDAPPLAGGGNPRWNVFTDETTDLRPSNALAEALIFNISPDYFRAAGTTLLTGRTFSWRDDKDAARVAVVNREFVRRLFGSATNAAGRYCKTPDGTRVQVVGIVEDGKYNSLTENPQPAMFLPILQSPSSSSWLVIRSSRDPQQLAVAMRNQLRDLDGGLPFFMQTWNRGLDTVLFPARVATLSLSVLGAMGAMLSISGIFGMAAYSVSKRLRELGIRIALGAQRHAVLQVALGGRIQIANCWFRGRVAARNSGKPRAGLHRISGNCARSAGIGWCCSCYGVAGATGYVDSGAARAVNRSGDTPARRMSYRGTDWNRFTRTWKAARLHLRRQSVVANRPFRSGQCPCHCSCTSLPTYERSRRAVSGPWRRAVKTSLPSSHQRKTPGSDLQSGSGTAARQCASVPPDALAPQSDRRSP